MTRDGRDGMSECVRCVLCVRWVSEKHAFPITSKLYGIEREKQQHQRQQQQQQPMFVGCVCLGALLYSYPLVHTRARSVCVPICNETDTNWNGRIWCELTGLTSKKNKKQKNLLNKKRTRTHAVQNNYSNNNNDDEQSSNLVFQICNPNHWLSA